MLISAVIALGGGGCWSVKLLTTLLYPTVQCEHGVMYHKKV